MRAPDDDPAVSTLICAPRCAAGLAWDGRGCGGVSSEGFLYTDGEETVRAIAFRVAYCGMFYIGVHGDVLLSDHGAQ